MQTQQSSNLKKEKWQEMCQFQQFGVLSIRSLDKLFIILYRSTYATESQLKLWKYPVKWRKDTEVNIKVIDSSNIRNAIIE